MSNSSLSSFPSWRNRQSPSPAIRSGRAACSNVPRVVFGGQFCLTVPQPLAVKSSDYFALTISQAVIPLFGLNLSLMCFGKTADMDNGSMGSGLVKPTFWSVARSGMWVFRCGHRKGVIQTFPSNAFAYSSISRFKKILTRGFGACLLASYPSPCPPVSRKYLNRYIF